MVGSIDEALEKGFQHTAARRRLLSLRASIFAKRLFQHTAARRRLHKFGLEPEYDAAVSTHSRAEAAAIFTTGYYEGIRVSTHSRAEAAAR